MYNILQARIEYRNKQLHKVTVLVEISQGDIRAICSTAGFKHGYDYLNPNEPVNDQLLQRVAGYGMGMPTADRDAAFPGWRGQ